MARALSDTGKQLVHLFTSPVVEHQFAGVDALNVQLRDIILRRESESPGERRSNIGGWHSHSDLDQWAGAAGQDLIRRIGEVVNAATEDYLRLYRRGIEAFRWRMTLWANVNRRGDYNRFHIHPGCTWSGVYYVDPGDAEASRPDSGNLVLQNPNLAATMTFFPGITPDVHAFRPRAGMLVMFPSYLPHDVQPYWGQRPRISIAFNAKREALA